MRCARPVRRRAAVPWGRFGGRWQPMTTLAVCSAVEVPVVNLVCNCLRAGWGTLAGCDMMKAGGQSTEATEQQRRQVAAAEAHSVEAHSSTAGGRGLWRRGRRQGGGCSGDHGIGHA